MAMHTDYFLDRCDAYINRRNELAELMSHRGRPHVAELRRRQAQLVRDLRQELEELERLIDEAPAHPPEILIQVVMLHATNSQSATYAVTWIDEYNHSDRPIPGVDILTMSPDRVLRKFRIRNEGSAFTTEEIVSSLIDEDPGMEKHRESAVTKALWQEFSGRLPDGWSPLDIQFIYGEKLRSRKNSSLETGDP